MGYSPQFIIGACPTNIFGWGCRSTFWFSSGQDGGSSWQNTSRFADPTLFLWYDGNRQFRDL